MLARRIPLVFLLSLACCEERTGTLIATIPGSLPNLDPNQRYVGLEVAQAQLSNRGSFEEAGGVMSLLVQRVSNPAGVVRATVRTYVGQDPDTATPGLDYVPFTSTLEWADGDTSSRLVMIEILDDPFVESDEVVRVQLADVQGALILPTGGDKALTILDDDGAQPVLAVPGIDGFLELFPNGDCLIAIPFGEPPASVEWIVHADALVELGVPRVDVAQQGARPFAVAAFPGTLWLADDGSVLGLGIP